MAMWLYQINQKSWPPERYRVEIWEGQRWSWPVGSISSKERPEAGDTVVFFCAPSGGSDAGFYGWAVVTEFYSEAGHELYFVPAAPSDTLKMMPWWDGEARKLVDEIRGPMKQRTMWPITEAHRARIRDGIRRWLGGAGEMRQSR